MSKWRIAGLERIEEMDGWKTTDGADYFNNSVAIRQRDRAADIAAEALDLLEELTPLYARYVDAEMAAPVGKAQALLDRCRVPEPEIAEAPESPSEAHTAPIDLSEGNFSKQALEVLKRAFEAAGVDVK